MTDDPAVLSGSRRWSIHHGLYTASIVAPCYTASVVGDCVPGLR